MLGHLALGYISSKALQRYLKYDINILYLAIFSLLPDIDFLFQNIKHRGPTHSLSAILLLFVMAIISSRLIPYLIAFCSHIIGDLITSQGVQLLWPIYKNNYKIPIPFLYGWNQLLIEFTLFILAMLLIYYFKDYKNILGS